MQPTQNYITHKNALFLLRMVGKIPAQYSQISYMWLLFSFQKGFIQKLFTLQAC